MRKIAVAFLILLLVSFARATQQKPAHQLSRAALEVAGVKLRLGMTRAQVAEKLAGREIEKLHDDEWMVGSFKNKELGPTLQFTDGVLSYADRSWTVYDNDIFDALFGVVDSFDKEGLSGCAIKADTNSSPALSAQRVWLLCGDKDIVVIRRSFGGKFYNSVEEQLGRMRDIE